MLLQSVVVFLVLDLVTSQPYIINTVPIGYLPAYHVPFKFEEIKKPDPNYNPRNVESRDIMYGCMPFGYDLPGSHSSFFGCRRKNDKLVYDENIFKPKRFLTSREKFITYPGELPPGHVRNENISAIWCYDTRGYGKGGHCKIMDGGIGKSYVRLHCYQTERNIPLRFRLEIYANSTMRGCYIVLVLFLLQWLYN